MTTDFHHKIGCLCIDLFYRLVGFVYNTTLCISHIISVLGITQSLQHVGAPACRHHGLFTGRGRRSTMYGFYLWTKQPSPRLLRLLSIQTRSHI